MFIGTYVGQTDASYRRVGEVNLEFRQFVVLCEHWERIWFLAYAGTCLRAAHAPHLARYVAAGGGGRGGDKGKIKKGGKEKSWKGGGRGGDRGRMSYKDPFPQYFSARPAFDVENHTDAQINKFKNV